MRNAIINLTSAQMICSATVGGIRRACAVQQENKNSKHDKSRSDLDIDVDGAGAECAFAKYLGAFWEMSVNTYKQHDVAGYQVRGTIRRDGRLIVRPNDNDDHEFVLVITADAPRYRIVGTFKCGDAKVSEFWDGDCWWVPQDRLGDLPAPLLNGIEVAVDMLGLSMREVSA